MSMVSWLTNTTSPGWNDDSFASATEWAIQAQGPARHDLSSAAPLIVTNGLATRQNVKISDRQ